MEVLMKRNILRSLVLVACGAALVGVLELLGGAQAAPPSGQQPFRNAVEQRDEIVQELREIKLLLKEQNALLRTFTAKAPFDAPLKP
jgi:hypothetical protein